MVFTCMYGYCIAYAISLMSAQKSQTRSGSCRALSKDIGSLIILLSRMDASRPEVDNLQLSIECAFVESMLRPAWETCPRAKTCEERGGSTIISSYGELQMAPETASTIANEQRHKVVTVSSRTRVTSSCEACNDSKVQSNGFEPPGDRPGSVRTYFSGTLGETNPGPS